MNFLKALNTGSNIRRESNKLCRVDKDYEDGKMFIDFEALICPNNLVDSEDLLADDWEEIDFFKNE